MIEKIDTVVVGAGQGGLATSFFLKQQGRRHVVLEDKDMAGSAWSIGRWDSFTLVTPNWTVRLPGIDAVGDPDGFMSKDEVVAMFQQYVGRHDLPVRHGSRVTAVSRDASSLTYRVETAGKVYDASNVVIATGLFQRPRSTPLHARLPRSVRQCHSSEYRNPGQLPQGAVLVVGSSQSGAQIADEVHKSGRRVYLCTGRAGRAPRSYRGLDSSRWLQLMGVSERTVDLLASPRAKFAANPHVVGKRGGGNLNLHQFARDGIHLLGKLLDVQGERLVLADDLHDNLAQADKFEADFTMGVDRHVAENKLDLPPEQLPQLRDGYLVARRPSLDLAEAGIQTIIWATGYDFDFNLVKLPIADDDGYPRQQRGITEFPGLYFVGLPWLHRQRSGLLGGVADDAQYVAADILSRHSADEDAPLTLAA